MRRAGGGFAADHLAYNATTRDWRTHEGLDLAAALGDPVCAAADGTVYTIYEDERYGTTVVLRHSGGFTSETFKAIISLTRMPVA